MVETNEQSALTLLALRRVDQELFAGRLALICPEYIRLQRLGETDYPRVVARKGGRKLVQHALLQALLDLGPDFLQKWRQQPARNAPMISDRPTIDDCWAEIQCPINVELLERVRPISAKFRHPANRCLFHRLKDIAAHGAAANWIECYGGAGLLYGGYQLFLKVFVLAVEDN